VEAEEEAAARIPPAPCPEEMAERVEAEEEAATAETAAVTHGMARKSMGWPAQPQTAAPGP
jgi:hypothetical protein